MGYSTGDPLLLCLVLQYHNLLTNWAPDVSLCSLLGSGVAVVAMTDDLVIPAPASLETKVHGVPEGCWYNFVQWSDDSKHISFTLRSAGRPPILPAGSEPLLISTCTLDNLPADLLLGSHGAKTYSSRCAMLGIKLPSSFHACKWLIPLLSQAFGLGPFQLLLHPPRSQLGCALTCAGGPDDPPRGPLELWVADSTTGAARSLLKNLNTIFDE